MPKQELQDVDLEKLTDEELLAMADAPAKEEEPAKESEEETVYRREIDLGDGSGKQVFEGATMDELVDKLATAQLNATKKIRELSRETKVEKAGEKTAAEKDLTADEEWLLSQELLNHPSKTQKKIIEGFFGMSIDDVRATLADARAMRAEKSANAASDEFVQKHADDYFACPANGQKIMKYISTYNLTPTVENLEKAFEDLQNSGLLESKPEDNARSAESDTAEHQDSSRIVKTETKPVTTQRRAGSGLTARGRNATPVTSNQPTEDELYDMPLDKLEALANRAARGVNSE